MSGTRLFAYGTLTIPRLILAVTGRSFAVEAARLSGYRSALISGCNYPGLAPAGGHQTRGVVYLDVDERSMNAIDRYEADEYVRRELTVDTDAGRLSAQVYVLVDDARALLSDEPWNRAAFERDHLDDYLNRLGVS